MKLLPFKLSEQEKQGIKEAGKSKAFRSFQEEVLIYLCLLALVFIFLWKHHNILILVVVAMAGIIGVRYSRVLKSSKATYSIGEKVEKEIKSQQEATQKVALPIIFGMVAIFVLVMAGLIIYVLYLKPHLSFGPSIPPSLGEQKEGTQEEVLTPAIEIPADLETKSRSYAYIWYKSDKVKVFLYAPNETKTVVRDSYLSCETPMVGKAVYQGSYKLILDPNTATVDSYGKPSGIMWEPAVLDLGKLKFVEDTPWDGKLIVEVLPWSDLRIRKNLIMIYQYGSCNTINVRMYGYNMDDYGKKDRHFIHYRFKGKDGLIKETILGSLGDVRRPLDISIKEPAFTSWVYSNITGAMEYTYWKFDAANNLFEYFPDILPSTGKFEIDYSEISELQKAVDAGHQPWRLDPEMVVKSQILQYGFTEEDLGTIEKLSLYQSTGVAEYEVMHNEKAYAIIIIQPVPGPAQIWTIKEIKLRE